MKPEQVDRYLRESVPVLTFQNPGHRESLLRQVIAAAGPSGAERWVPSRPGRWRAAFIGAAAACAAAVITFTVVYFTVEPNGVLAQGISAIREATAMKCEISRRDPAGGVLDATLYWVAPDFIRLDQRGETAWIQGNRITSVRHEGKQTEIAVNMPHLVGGFKEMVSGFVTPGRLLDLYASAVEDRRRVKRVSRDGRVLGRFEVKTEKNTEAGPILYIDLETALPVEIQDQNDAATFTWNPVVAPDLMEARIPEGTEPPRIIDGSIQAPRHVVLAGEGIGPVRLGMTLEEVEAIWGEADRIHLPSVDYYDHGVQLRISPEGGVEGISGVLGEKMSGFFKTFAGRTPESLGIGSTEEEILDVLGEPDFRVSAGRHVSGEALSLTMKYNNRGVWFQIQPGYFEDQGGKARVTSIFIEPIDETPPGRRQPR